MFNKTGHTVFVLNYTNNKYFVGLVELVRWGIPRSVSFIFYSIWLTFFECDLRIDLGLSVIRAVAVCNTHFLRNDNKLALKWFIGENVCKKWKQIKPFDRGHFSNQARFDIPFDEPSSSQWGKNCAAKSWQIENKWNVINHPFDGCKCDRYIHVCVRCIKSYTHVSAVHTRILTNLSLALFLTYSPNALIENLVNANVVCEYF